MPGKEDAPPFNTEACDRISENPFLQVASHPLSPFSVEVDSASCATMRRSLTCQEHPPEDAVRIEEFITSFPLDYPRPDGETPFSGTTEGTVGPRNRGHRRALIGPQEQRVGVSASLNDPVKLPLVKAARGMLAKHLTERDRVAMVV